jgi:SAM-dependent methyltransferase
VEERLLILHLRPARRRAREAAIAEAAALLRGLHPRAETGGPLSEQGGIVWIAIDSGSVDEAIARVPRLGYSHAVDLLEPIERTGKKHEQLVRWRGRLHRLVRVHDEDPAVARDGAPDRRTFLLETSEGTVRPVVGYRGDGGPLSRRGLPVADARLLANLVFSPASGVFLDPFAGIGGIAIEAIAAGWRVVTLDVDRGLRHGLHALGAHHVVADACHLPFPDRSIDAIATEPPYDPIAEGTVRSALREMSRVLLAGGRLAMLVADWQHDLLAEGAHKLGLVPFLDCPIDRKGLAVAVLAWQQGSPEGA